MPAPRNVKQEKQLQVIAVGVDMENYMDGSFVVTNNTIIAYTGQHPTLKVPGRFADIEVSRIGDGSFMESNKLQCVVLPPQTKEIGNQAFSKCPVLTSAFVPGGLTDVGSSAFGWCQVLSDITIYGLELTADEYRTYKATSNRNNDGIYVLHQIPKHAIVNQLVSSISNAKPAYKIPNEIPSLFQMVELDEQKGKFSLEKNVPVIGFSVPSVPTTENLAFHEHLRRGAAEVYNETAEQKNDWYVRVGKIPTKEKTIIFTFDDTKTKEDKGTFIINATLKIGYFFWQSAQPVVYSKKQYYVYRRHYLSSDPEIEYVRDIAVYSDKGLVTNREEAQNVYAKYKLLSIL